MRIRNVTANNWKKMFVVATDDGRLLDFPYAKMDFRPTPEDPIEVVFPDPEAGCEAFTARLESGAEDSVHIDAILEYNGDPRIFNEMLLYRLTLEAETALRESGLSKREVIRRLHTSATQLYRLLDPTNYSKSVDQMLLLLTVLGKYVDLVVRPRIASQGSERPRLEDHKARGRAGSR